MELNFGGGRWRRSLRAVLDLQLHDARKRRAIEGERVAGV